MSEHRAVVHWQNDTATLDYDRFSRDHTWQVKEGRVTVPASSAPAYLGSADRMDPEDALVAAISSCHMLTFLAIAARKRLVVLDYSDVATGWLEPNAEGQVALTRVELAPRVRLAPGSTLSGEDYLKIHEKAHRGCFIANSVKANVTCRPTLEQ